MNIYNEVKTDTDSLKKDILSNKIRYASNRDKINGEPVSYRFKEPEISEIINEYILLKLSCREIGRKHNRNHGDIVRLLKRKNIPIISSYELSKKYTINENYFENIDCHKKAYWIGWLFSDGSILRNGKEIRIKLQERDKYILEELSKDLNSNAPLKKSIIPKGYKIVNNYSTKEFVYYELRICCSKMVCHLAKYGVVWNKGKRNIGISNIPEEFMSSFILGEFEGDGHLSMSKTTSLYHQLSIWDIEPVCTIIKNYLSKKLNREIGIVEKRKNVNIYTYRLSRERDLIDIYNLIYKSRDFGFCLKRKEDKFIFLLNHISKRLLKKTSKYRGVFKHSSGKYCARISKTHIGMFDNEIDAARAYDAKSKEIYGNKAQLNFYE